jgi:outer membrane protein OmpA-like peptidoglycan-associated protein
MAVDLFQMIRGVLTPDVVDTAASRVGERPSATQRALDAIVPSLLAGVLRYGETEGGAALLGLLSQAPDGDVPTDLTAGGRDLAQTIFGRRLPSVVDVIAGASGVRSSSASSLLTMATPLVLGVLGRVRSTQGLDAGGLMRLLAEHRDAIVKAAPPGLAAALGTPVRDAPRSDAYQPAIREPASPMRWAFPLLLVGLLLGGLWYAMRQPAHEAERRAAVPPAGEAAGVGAGSAERLAAVQLPGGAAVTVEENGPLYRLAVYLRDPSGTTPSTFALHRIGFEVGSAVLTPDANRTLDDLAAILKAYPSARVRLEAHTDNLGDAAANMGRSRDRAEAVEAALTTRGVDTARIEAAGFGEERPVASNDTEDGRAQNRRLELVVVSR